MATRPADYPLIGESVPEDIGHIVEAGIRAGVAAALRDHKRAGVPIVVSENGVIRKIQPEDIPDDGVFPEPRS